MTKKQIGNQLQNSPSLSSQKIWETTDPMATNITALNRSNKSAEDENDEMKGTKRKIQFVNVAAIVICTGVLINRISICLERCYISYPPRMIHI